MSRTVHLSLFCSAKGGVGKSTLAIAKAQLVAPRGRVLLVDGDFTGSSLADGLDLQAPDLPEGADGTLDLATSRVPGHCSVDQTRERRRLRYRRHSKALPAPRLLPFFNDAITWQGELDCNPALLGWYLPGHDSIEVWPSSPFRPDVEVALRWLSRPAKQRRPVLDRIAGLVTDRLLQDPAITHVVFDLPPGIFGFTEDFLKLTQELRDSPPAGLSLTTDVVVVATDDRNDLLAATPGLVRIRAALHPGARMIVNRARSPMSDIARTLDQEFAPIPVRRWVHRVDTHASTLGRVFLRGNLMMDAAVEAQLRDALGAE